MKVSMIAVVLLALGVGLTSVRAVDPLPRELENAPLAKQAEYWQRTSSESERLRTKVAHERYQNALSYKRTLQAQQEERHSEVQARIEEEIKGGTSSTAGAGPEGGSWAFYLMVAAGFVGGVVCMHRQLKQSDAV